jgi:hypothetical protein
MMPAETARREAGAALVEALDVLSAALPRAVQMARTEERAAERAAVVAWLRDEVDAAMHLRAPVRAATFLGCAEAIERGQHRREEGK